MLPIPHNRQHGPSRQLKCTKSNTFPIVASVEKLGARPRRTQLSPCFLHACNWSVLL